MNDFKTMMSDLEIKNNTLYLYNENIIVENVFRNAIFWNPYILYYTELNILTKLKITILTVTDSLIICSSQKLHIGEKYIDCFSHNTYPWTIQTHAGNMECCKTKECYIKDVFYIREEIYR